MRSYGWLVVIFAYLTTVHAWPETPRLELQQAEIAAAASEQQPIQSTCKRITALMDISKMAANQTWLDDLMANNQLSQEQVNDIKTKQDTINAELQELSSNNTLMAECGTINAHRKAVKDCKKLDKLERLVEMANNKTAYDEHLAGELLNKVQLEQLKKNMENAEIKLQELRSNSTLVELCTNEIGLQQNGATAGQQAGSIGEAVVDNTGVISLSTSSAVVLRIETWASTCAIGFGSFFVLLLL